MQGLGFGSSRNSPNFKSIFCLKTNKKKQLESFRSVIKSDEEMCLFECLVAFQNTSGSVFNKMHSLATCFQTINL